MSAVPAVSRPALGDFQRRRKQDSRQQLLAAATEVFCANGYFAISVDEIATAAGVSRMTFYRHFSSKAALAAELFRQSSEAAMPRLLAIGQRDFRERQVVLAWIAELFEANRASGPILRVFMQANAEELGFTQTGHSFITDLIVRLGQYIPAFALDPDDPRDRRGWVAAWLLLYEILDQGNHAARGAGVATDPLAIEILGERFLGFVNAEVRRGR